MFLRRGPTGVRLCDVRARDYETLAAFRLALRQFLGFSEEEARRAGLTPRQYQALLAIHGARWEAPGPTVGELAAHLLVRHHSAVGLVDRLQALGYVRRFPDADDRRRVVVALTPRGRARLASLASAHRRELRGLAGRLRSLLDALEKS